MDPRIRFVEFARSSSPRAMVRRRLCHKLRVNIREKYVLEKVVRRRSGAGAREEGDRVAYGSLHALLLLFYCLRRTLQGTYVF